MGLNWEFFSRYKFHLLWFYDRQDNVYISFLSLVTSLTHKYSENLMLEKHFSLMKLTFYGLT